MLISGHQRKLCHDARPMISKPCSMFKSNSLYQNISQSSANKSNQNKTYTQGTRLMYKPAKAIPCGRSLSGTKLYSRGSSSQENYVNKSTLSQKGTIKQESHNCSARCYTRRSNSTVSSPDRCFSASAAKYFNKASEKLCKNYRAKCGVTTGQKATGTKQRCMSATNSSRNSILVSNTLTQRNNTNQWHQNSVGKSSSSLLSKSNNFDRESMSDVISFSDELIEQQLDAYSTSDESAVLDIKWRPQSCISFQRTVVPAEIILPNHKHYCSTFLKNRPNSSPCSVR